MAKAKKTRGMVAVGKKYQVTINEKIRANGFEVDEGDDLYWNIEDGLLIFSKEPRESKSSDSS